MKYFDIEYDLSVTVYPYSCQIVVLSVHQLWSQIQPVDDIFAKYQQLLI